MRWRMWLKLGRVSNLPTVWSNVLAGWALSGAALEANALALLMALSLFYVAGMYLNDAFDAAIDARERAERPIPLGEVGRSTVGNSPKTSMDQFRGHISVCDLIERQSQPIAPRRGELLA